VILGGKKPPGKGKFPVPPKRKSLEKGFPIWLGSMRKVFISAMFIMAACALKGIVFSA
jgi:hypothetical protein